MTKLAVYTLLLLSIALTIIPLVYGNITVALINSIIMAYGIFTFKTYYKCWISK